MKRKRNLLLKERKLSAVNLVFTGENEARCGEHKPVKKQDLTWKSRMFLFQSLPWKSKAERSKAGFDVCQVECGERKLDGIPKD